MNGSRIAFFGLDRQYTDLREHLLWVTNDVLSTGGVMEGPRSAELEQWLQDRTGYQHAVLCHSGTQALEIIARFFYQRLSVWNDQQRRVLIPDFTYPATANAWINAGWQIQLVDVTHNGLMQLIDLPKADAICWVGLYGAPLPDYRWPRGSFLVEDGAQHWLTHDPRDLWRSANMAISFDPTKNLGAYGNGGAIVSDDRDLAYFARNWVSNGRTSHWDRVGSNSRMSEMDCAQLLVKTQYIDQWQRRRTKIAEFWVKKFQTKNIRCLTDPVASPTHCLNKFVIETLDRDRLRQCLYDAGIDTRCHYDYALHELGAYCHYPNPGALSKSAVLSRQVLSLPIYPELTDSEVEFISEQVLAHV